MNRDLNNKLHFYLTAAVSFLIPVHPKLIPVAIALLTLNWFLGKKFTGLFAIKDSTILFMIASGLYVMYCFGLLYTENMNFAWKDLETKLSLLIFPFIFYSTPRFSEENFSKIMMSFVYGCLAAAIICFLHALYNYFHTQYLLSQNIWAWNYGINFFLKDRLSIWIHPTYIAMYFVFALAIIYSLNKKGKFSSQFWIYFFAFILFIFVFLFSSKAGLISLFLFGLYFLTEKIIAEKKYLVSFLAVSAALVIFFSLYFAAPEFSGKIDEAIAALTGNVHANSPASTASRMEIWNSSLKVIKNNFWFGTGTGDVKDVLLHQYALDGLTFAVEHKLNAHNQFLQTFASTGFIGLLLLVMGIVAPYAYSLRKKNTLFAIFLTLVTVNFFTESMLETQAGAIFIAFFNCLFLFAREE